MEAVLCFVAHSASLNRHCTRLCQYQAVRISRVVRIGPPFELLIIHVQLRDKRKELLRSLGPGIAVTVLIATAFHLLSPSRMIFVC
jgi:hypothetical protein